MTYPQHGIWMNVLQVRKELAHHEISDKKILAQVQMVKCFYNDQEYKTASRTKHGTFPE